MRFFLMVERSFYYSIIKSFLHSLKALLGLGYTKVNPNALPFVGYKSNTIYSVFFEN